MFTFFKAQAASITATLVDILVTIFFVEALQCWYVAGSIAGTVSGGITHFSMCRNWVFDASGRKMPAQIFKYLLVWNGNLLLTSTGIFLVTHYMGINYAISKMMISVLVGITYNYLLQKNFVFK